MNRITGQVIKADDSGKPELVAVRTPCGGAILRVGYDPAEGSPDAIGTMQVDSADPGRCTLELSPTRGGGPARVASDAYRTNYDAIFGRKDLN